MALTKADMAEKLFEDLGKPSMTTSVVGRIPRSRPQPRLRNPWRLINRNNSGDRATCARAQWRK